MKSILWVGSCWRVPKLHVSRQMNDLRIEGDVVSFFSTNQNQDHCEGELLVNTSCNDRGGRRKKADRRQFSYTFHIPERRSGSDRRNHDERRKMARNPGGNMLNLAS